LGKGSGGEKGEILGAPPSLKKNKLIQAPAHRTSHGQQGLPPPMPHFSGLSEHPTDFRHGLIEPAESDSTAIRCFFQAEDGIRDWSVTGVQTCALPIWRLATVGGVRETQLGDLVVDAFT